MTVPNHVPGEAWTILCVDDEPHILSSLRRLLKPHGYRFLGANSAEEGIALLGTEKVDLIISDMRMPGMQGAEFLGIARERWPSVIRVMLTGYSDVSSTIEAINKGEIYRYVSKPWNDLEVLGVLDQALERRRIEHENHRLQAALVVKNAELNELNGSLEERVAARTEEVERMARQIRKSHVNTIKTFSTLLEWREGLLAGHSRRVADMARKLAQAMACSEQEIQDVFIAGLIHDIGLISLPDKVIEKPVSLLQGEDLQRYEKHPAFGEQILLSQDDQQMVAAIIRSHHERHDGAGFPDRLVGAMIPLGARILAVTDTYDDLCHGRITSAKLSEADTCSVIARGRGSQFDPEVVDVFLQMRLAARPVPEKPPRLVRTEELRAGMRLARDLVSPEGLVLLSTGHVIQADLIRRLKLRETRDNSLYNLYVTHD
ncbi:HD domain-containing phosphohydrolase [Curvibacter gracilis]|uniref:HD domain-containing phosphohydrolase n=1 Tax=Curvibacter gracilis TaxID=230310 RepID=UPI0005B78592|nr:HD domain-containing phosphohydrolase [Curvibacter gracilis]